MSQATVPASIVLRAATEYVKRVERSREERRERLIAEAQRPFRFLGFEFGGCSREQAIKNLSSDLWNDYGLIELRGAYWYDRAENLIKMASIPGVSEITLDTTDFSILKDYI